MASNSNIRDSNWNSSFSFHSIHIDLLTDISNSLDLCLSKSIHQVPTRYSDNMQNNFVISFMFLRPNSLEFNNHTIYPKLWYLFDHTLLTVDISIIKKFILDKWHIIIKNNEKEIKFITDIIEAIKNMDTEQIKNKELLKFIVQEFTNKTESIWYNYLKCINITKHFKVWWNEEYQSKLAKYRMFKQLED